MKRTMSTEQMAVCFDRAAELAGRALGSMPQLADEESVRARHRLAQVIAYLTKASAGMRNVFDLDGEEQPPR